MSKNWIMLTGLLLLGFVGPTQAHPWDAPDIVYVDGLPCNSACQIYLAWSRRKVSFAAQHSAPVESAPSESPPLKLVPETPALRSRAARFATQQRCIATAQSSLHAVLQNGLHLCLP